MVKEKAKQRLAKELERVEKREATIRAELRTVRAYKSLVLNTPKVER